MRGAARQTAACRPPRAPPGTYGRPGHGFGPRRNPATGDHYRFAPLCAGVRPALVDAFETLPSAAFGSVRSGPCVRVSGFRSVADDGVDEHLGIEGRQV